MISPAKSSIVRKTLDVNYDNKKKATSFKWSLINAVLFVIFACDLWYKCPGHTSWLHYVEGALTLLACASGTFHALRYSRLSLATAANEKEEKVVFSPSHGRPEHEEVLSLSRSWSTSPLSAHDRSPSPSPSSPRLADVSFNSSGTNDEFISDKDTLINYLRQLEARRAPPPQEPGAAAAPPAYQTAPLRWGAEQEGAGGARGGEGRGAAAGADWAPGAGWLAERTRALRLWLQLTVLRRVEAQLALADAELAALGAGAVAAQSRERLRQLAGVAPAVAPLLPFLEPFANRRYAVQRVRELAAGGCLSAYRWCGGGSYEGRPWDESLPTDAEIVMQLFTAYMDSQLRVGAVEGSAGAFSERHVGAAAAAGAEGARGERAQDELRVTVERGERGGRYGVAVGGRAVRVPEGRDNLLQALLLLLAAAARRRPPALQRVHLGRAGLNVLWVLGLEPPPAPGAC